MQAFYRTTTASKEIGSSEHRRKGTPNLLLRQAFDALRREGLEQRAHTEHTTDEEGFTQYVHLWHFQDAEFMPGVKAAKVGQIYEVTASTYNGARQAISVLLSQDFDPEIAARLSGKDWAPAHRYLVQEHGWNNRVGWGGSTMPWFLDKLVEVKPVVVAQFAMSYK